MLLTVTIYFLIIALSFPLFTRATSSFIFTKESYVFVIVIVIVI